MREVGQSVGNMVFGTLGRVMARTQERRSLPVDLLESDESYLAIFDAPGVLSSDLSVRFEQGTIYVRLDRFRDTYDGFEMMFPGRGLSLDGQVDLPDEARVDPDGATATLKEDGTLQVEVPKLPEAETDRTKE